MTESYVVDASVVSKWFNKGESNEEQATLLREAWVERRVRLVAPSLIIFEVANSIWKNPGTPDALARSLVKTATNLSPTPVNLSVRLCGQAMQIARKTKTTFYDAIYLAVARTLSLALISADGKQLSASKGYVKSVHVSEISETIAR